MSSLGIFLCFCKKAGYFIKPQICSRFFLKPLFKLSFGQTITQIPLLKVSILEAAKIVLSALFSLEHWQLGQKWYLLSCGVKTNEPLHFHPFFALGVKRSFNHHSDYRGCVHGRFVRDFCTCFECADTEAAVMTIKKKCQLPRS
jgi:hypothetical protein